MLVGSITTRQPEWDAEQLDLLIAHQRYTRGIGRYGETLAEATDPRADPMEYGPYRYVAHAHVNWAERAAKESEAEFRKSLPEDTPMPAGLFWTVEKVEN